MIRWGARLIHQFKLKAASRVLDESQSAGSRTLSRELRAKGHRVGRHMARGLMREAWVARHQRHRYKSSGVEALVAPHVLKRTFDVTAINQVWCSDVTYVKVGKCWMYFVVVLDLFARTNIIKQIGVLVSVLPGIP